MVREDTGLQLGINQLTIQFDIELSITSRNQSNRLESSLVNAGQMIRQPDGLRFKVSSRAVSDGNFHLFSFNRLNCHESWIGRTYDSGRLPASDYGCSSGSKEILQLQPGNTKGECRTLTISAMLQSHKQFVSGR